MFYASVFRGDYYVFTEDSIDEPVSEPREWTNNDFNFDDVSQGMLTLFTVATFEGWPE